MYLLEQALYDHELIVLRVIGEWWELDLTGVEKRECVQALVDALNRLDMTQEINFLSPEEANAIQDLVLAGGRISVAAFERDHGEVRNMGPGKMEREEPWLDPISPTEALWYRGLLYRAFDETADKELVEYYYLPTEFSGQLAGYFGANSTNKAETDTLLVPIGEPETFNQASIDAIDDLTALLTAAQIAPLREDDLPVLRPILLDQTPDRASLLLTLAWEMDLLRLADDGAKPARPVIAWLQQSRESQLRQLADAWSRSGWNDLCHTPGIICDGSGWENDPLLARTALLDALPRERAWFSLNDLVESIHQNDPDFQRPDGNYNTWYIRDRVTNDYLRGFETWHSVEGRLLHFLMTGPMSWLGLIELAHDPVTNQSLFRLAERAHDWLVGRSPSQQEVTVPIIVHDDATVSVPFNANRYHRFQVGRVAEAEPAVLNQPFRYCLTPRSLARARDQGIDPIRLLTFLQTASERPLPASTRRAIERWSERGTEGKLERVVLLHVADSDILDKLRGNPKTQIYIAESMGDLAAVVRHSDWPKLRRAAAQLGLLLDDSGASESQMPN